MINLEKVVFFRIEDEKLRKEIKKEISKFRLVTEDFEEISICHSYKDNQISLCCGYIAGFEFPKDSKNEKIEHQGKNDVKITFNYHNREYLILGHF